MTVRLSSLIAGFEGRFESSRVCLPSLSGGGLVSVADWLRIVKQRYSERGEGDAKIPASRQQQVKGERKSVLLEIWLYKATAKSLTRDIEVLLDLSLSNELCPSAFHNGIRSVNKMLN